MTISWTLLLVSIANLLKNPLEVLVAMSLRRRTVDTAEQYMYAHGIYVVEYAAILGQAALAFYSLDDLRRVFRRTGVSIRHGAH